MDEKDKIDEIIKEKGLSYRDVLEIFMRMFKHSHWKKFSKKHLSKFESFYQKEKLKYSDNYQSDMESLYDKLKMEEKYFKPDAPTNFTVGFYTEGDRAKGLSVAAKYGSVTGKPPLKTGTGYSLIISRTQLLALKDAGIRFFPTYDKCFANRGK